MCAQSEIIGSSMLTDPMSICTHAFALEHVCFRFERGTKAGLDLLRYKEF